MSLFSCFSFVVNAENFTSLSKKKTISVFSWLVISSWFPFVLVNDSVSISWIINLSTKQGVDQKQLPNSDLQQATSINVTSSRWVYDCNKNFQYFNLKRKVLLGILEIVLKTWGQCHACFQTSFSTNWSLWLSTNLKYSISFHQCRLHRIGKLKSTVNYSNTVIKHNFVC